MANITETQIEQLGINILTQAQYDAAEKKKGELYIIKDAPELATQREVLDVENKVDDHIADTNNPHEVTKAQVGLSDVDNTSDMDKPVSNAQQTALNLKQDALTPGTNMEIVDNTINTTATQIIRRKW
jgi:hypothetical protein